MTIWWIIQNKILHRRRYFQNGWNEAEKKVIECVKEFHGNLFVDVGCNRKFYTELLKNNFRQIITIDPNPKWNADLKIALSDFDGTAPFHILTDNGAADSLIKDPLILGEKWVKKAGISYMDPINVEVKRWDSLQLVADLVKIDVEASEVQVIDGMNTYLPRKVVLEVHNPDEEELIRERMRVKGYARVKIDDTHFLFTLL